MIRGIGNTMDVYVGRCVKSVTYDVIIKYIENETNINVIDCYCLSDENSKMKAFKVTVSSDDRDALLVGSLWPENVVVRKFLKKRNNGRQHQ